MDMKWKTLEDAERDLSNIKIALFDVIHSTTHNDQTRSVFALMDDCNTIAAAICRQFFLYDVNQPNTRPLADHELASIHDNLRAFVFNFGKIGIVKTLDNAIKIFVNGNIDLYEDLASNVDYLNGWLSGCVKVGNNRIERSNDNES